MDKETLLELFGLTCDRLFYWKTYAMSLALLSIDENEILDALNLKRRMQTKEHFRPVIDLKYLIVVDLTVCQRA